MVCSCGAVVTQQQKFCRTCGAPVNEAVPRAAGPGARSCVRCGNPLAANARFCRGCGSAVDSTPGLDHLSTPTATRTRSHAAWLVPLAALLCIAVLAGTFFWWTRRPSVQAPD